MSLLLSAGLSAQVFTDDFESYTAGNDLASSSSDWTTWSGNAGGSDDVEIANDQASSGSNSLYFASTSQSGGPTDIVLPFASVYNTGDFSFQTEFRVGSGKNAYFNFQANATIGQTWGLSCNFNSNGTFALDNTDAGILLEGSYTQGSWLTLKMEADLNTGSWEVFIDNVSQGTFQNPILPVASINIYPLQGSGFWMDDVEYNHTAYALVDKNLGMIQVSNLTGLAGQVRHPNATVRNLGTTTITSFDLVIDYNGTQVTEQITGVNINSLDVYELDFTNSVTLQSGSNDLTISISNVNGAGSDDDASDDELTLNIDPLVPAAGKVVLVEEATGTWCGFCPRGAVFMDQMSDDYGHFFAGIAVHNGDPMANSMYDGGLNSMIDGYPSAVVERGSDIDPSDIENPFLNKIMQAPKVWLENGAELTADSLLVSVKVSLQEALSGNYKIACAITQDEMSGTTSGWAQSNYYSSGDFGAMGGYEDLPATVPASDMVYNHVGRAISPTFEGYHNAFANANMAGDEVTFNFSFPIQSDWDTEKMHIIAFVNEPNGATDNASHTTVNEAIDAGYESGVKILDVEELSFNSSKTSLYPNPAQDLSYVQLSLNKEQDVTVILKNIQGQTISEKNYGMLQGTYQLPIETLQLASGIYLVDVKTGSEVQSLKLVIE